MNKMTGNVARSAWQVGRRAMGAVVARPKASAARFWRDNTAITSLEFALIALPFFGLILGTMTVGIWYFYETCLDIGVYKSGRQVMTGQFQTQGLTTPQAFSTSILCPNMPAYIPCSTTNPTILMAVVNDPSSLFTPTVHTLSPGPPPVTYDTYTLNPLPTVICSPQQGSIVYIHAEYQMPPIIAMFTIFGGTPHGVNPQSVFDRYVTSGAMVKVEEFPLGSATVDNCANQSGTPCCPA